MYSLKMQDQVKLKDTHWSLGKMLLDFHLVYCMAISCVNDFGANSTVVGGKIYVYNRANNVCTNTLSNIITPFTEITH